MRGRSKWERERTSWTFSSPSDDDIGSISRDAVRQEITGEERISSLYLYEIYICDLCEIYAYTVRDKSIRTLLCEEMFTRLENFYSLTWTWVFKRIFELCYFGIFFSINLFLQWFLEYIQVSKFIYYWLIHEWIFLIHYSSL